MPKIECSCCGKLVEENQFGKEDRYYELYVGMGSYQYVCKECQKKPFKEVMENLNDTVYPAGESETLEELRNKAKGKQNIF